MIQQTRRSVLCALLATSSTMLLLRDAAEAQDLRLSLTPSCTGDADETLEQTEGPFYKSDAPERTSLGAAGAGQTKFTLCGFVLDTRCRPVPDAVVEIWHADHEGNYDNRGFGWRGFQLTDSEGRWGFDTIATHHYSFRTAHYHFRVKAPDRPLLTTQLYLPDHPRNDGDRLFDPRLVLALDRGADIGRYDFVVAS